MRKAVVKWMLWSIFLLPGLLLSKEIERGQSGTFLWEISKSKEGPLLGTLFGTMHLGKEGTTLPKEVAERVQQADLLYTEVALTPSAEEDIDALNSLFFKSYDPAGELRQALSEDEFRVVQELFIKAKYPLEMAAAVKPWLVFMLLGYEMDAGYSAESGVESLLKKLIAIHQIPNQGLESYSVGLSAFYELPEEKLIPAIRIMLENLEELRSEATSLAELYKNNEVEALVAYFEDGVSYLNYIPAEDYSFWTKWVNETLVKARNIAWMPTIIEALESEKLPFIAVGAGHLFGEQGVIELLKEAGFTLKPIMLDTLDALENMVSETELEIGAEEEMILP